MPTSASPEEFIATLQHRLAITKRSLAEAQQTIDTLAGTLQAERDARTAATGPIPDDVCDPQYTLGWHHGRKALMRELASAEPVAWLTDREAMYFDREDARRDSDGFIEALIRRPEMMK